MKIDLTKIPTADLKAWKQAIDNELMMRMKPDMPLMVIDALKYKRALP